MAVDAAQLVLFRKLSHNHLAHLLAGLGDHIKGDTNLDGTSLYGRYSQDHRSHQRKS